jgi:type I restriction enzyme R subunit
LQGRIERLAERVRKSTNERCTLDVLRRDVEMLALKEPLSPVQFKPEVATNPAIQLRYRHAQLAAAGTHTSAIER